MWEKDFVECLEKSTAAHPLIDKAFDIKQRHMPKQIYKYFRDCSYTRDNLKTDTVWLCSPDAYNDPYDCAFTISEDMVVESAIRILFEPRIELYNLQDIISKDEIEKAKSSKRPLLAIAEYISILISKMPERNLKQMAELASSVLPEFINNIVSFLPRMQKDTKVCSFSAIHDSIIMWSHYADNHKGFCVEYELEPLMDGHACWYNLYKVIYSRKLYDLTRWAELMIGPDRDQSNPVYPLLATIHKFYGWKYEEEWRLVLLDSKLNDDRNYNVPTPTRVLLGSKMETSSKKELREICKERNIEVWEMHRVTNSFELTAMR
jgi:hypothetical protein